MSIFRGGRMRIYNFWTALLRPLGCTAGVASSRLPRSEPSRLRSLSFLPPLSSVLLVTHPLCTSCWLTHAGCRHPSTAASQPAQRRLPCTGTLTFAVVKRCVEFFFFELCSVFLASHRYGNMESPSPLAKCTNSSTHDDYRLITWTCFFAKIFEKLSNSCLD